MNKTAKIVIGIQAVVIVCLIVLFINRSNDKSKEEMTQYRLQAEQAMKDAQKQQEIAEIQTVRAREAEHTAKMAQQAAEKEKKYAMTQRSIAQQAELRANDAMKKAVEAEYVAKMHKQETEAVMSQLQACRKSK